MQRIKDNTCSLLLDTAREAFLEKDFKGVSMREISEKSDVGLSNIYNYFRNKDELRETVLKPFLKAFKEVMSNHSSEKIQQLIFLHRKIISEIPFTISELSLRGFGKN